MTTTNQVFEAEREELQVRLNALATETEALKRDCVAQCKVEGDVAPEACEAADASELPTACMNVVHHLERFIHEVAPRVMDAAAGGDAQAHERLFRALDKLQGVPTDLAREQREAWRENFRQLVEETVADVESATKVGVGVAVGALFLYGLAAVVVYAVLTQKASS